MESSGEGGPGEEKKKGSSRERVCGVKMKKEGGREMGKLKRD